MNCFACHGGTLYGATYPGAPNTMYALESFTEAVRKAKLQLGKPLTHMDVGSLVMPLGTTNGTSNAVMFGVALMNFRDADLNFLPDKLPAAMTHHDMDAPPWWHFYRKSHLYIDGFAQKGHKGLMQFMLVRENGPEKFRQWESDFQDVYQFLEELRPPKYPLAIEQSKAERGRKVYLQNCAQCHGTYDGNKLEYPERMVEIDDIGTDRVRFDALTPQQSGLLLPTYTTVAFRPSGICFIPISGLAFGAGWRWRWTKNTSAWLSRHSTRCPVSFRKLRSGGTSTPKFLGNQPKGMIIHQH